MSAGRGRFHSLTEAAWSVGDIQSHQKQHNSIASPHHPGRGRHRHVAISSRIAVIKPVTPFCEESDLFSGIRDRQLALRNSVADQPP